MHPQQVHLSMRNLYGVDLHSRVDLAAYPLHHEYRCANGHFYFTPTTWAHGAAPLTTFFLSLNAFTLQRPSPMVSQGAVPTETDSGKAHGVIGQHTGSFFLYAFLAPPPTRAYNGWYVVSAS